MSGAISRSARRLYSMVLDPILCWQAENRLRRELSCFSDEQLERVLADAGMSQGDLAAIFKGRARNRSLMAAMMEHFGVRPKEAGLRYWGALRDAERVCAHCSSVRRCRRWLEWGARNDAPRVFCPNAPLFDEIAESGRRQADESAVKAERRDRGDRSAGAPS